MLRIILSNKYALEKEYISEILLNNFLGVDFVLEYKSNITYFEIRYGSKSLYINDVFFQTSEKEWLTYESLPQKVKSYVDCKEYFPNYKGSNRLSVIFGDSQIKCDSEKIYIGVDIFGSCFFMLTRYEEYVIRDRDSLDRFEYENSFAYKNDFLDRPIVNEYLELLWCGIQKLVPNIKRKKLQYKVVPTHDIDKPFGILYDSSLQILRHFVGDIVYRRGLKVSFKRIKRLKDRCLNKTACIDEGNEVIDFIIDTSKKYGLKDIFYFMHSKESLYDGNYYADYNDVINLMKKILSKGHSIGLHPSYNSYLNKDDICEEAKSLLRIVKEHAGKSIIGGRQHYLRWSNPETWRAYEYAGLKTDSTLTFAGHVGFRCGVCYPYKVFDLIKRKTLDVEEHPLIVMDGTLFEYMKLSENEAMEICTKLAEQCKKYNGEFVFLWHNTMLYEKEKREFYAKLLESVASDKRDN